MLPEDFRRHSEDLKRNIHAVINARLAKMDLVTREEFDVQSELLSRTRVLADELEQRVRDLETRYKNTDNRGSRD